jgi:hypothetical protein
MPQQELRYQADAWEEKIAVYLSGRSKVLISEVGFEGLHIETPRLGTAEQNRIRAAMRRQGWEPRPKDWQGNRYWTKGGE